MKINSIPTPRRSRYAVELWRLECQDDSVLGYPGGFQVVRDSGFKVPWRWIQNFPPMRSIWIRQPCTRCLSQPTRILAFIIPAKLI